ncbi:Ppx/GppA phosphatase family protein [Desulfurispora thermophila]|uniref:Ppx/GppA phosphatase family protein n=1 Tax=Desulfurispora thermophila TaxID=265470 RepID=UPI00036B11D7|nr:Ppx/GppA phosphatase family protein [Desulfurispora thermophila]
MSNSAETAERVAVIDVGSNSLRLLIADIFGPRSLKRVHFALQTTRLGQGIGGGYLLPEAVQRTLAALQEFQVQVDARGCRKVVVVATSAVRDAANREEFCALVHRTTGWPVRVLRGEEEAFYSYSGVLLAGGFAPGIVVADVGGGSSELTTFRAGQLITRSVPVGAVRMTEGGHSAAEIRRLLSPLVQSLSGEPIDFLVGVGGTATTLAALDQEMVVYQPEKVQGYSLSRARVEEIHRRLAGLTLEERCRLPGLQPARADIIVAGVQIVLLLMELLGARRLVVSEADLLDGLAVEVAAMA